MHIANPAPIIQFACKIPFAQDMVGVCVTKLPYSDTNAGESESDYTPIWDIPIYNNGNKNVVKPYDIIGEEGKSVIITHLTVIDVIDRYFRPHASTN